MSRTRCAPIRSTSSDTCATEPRPNTTLGARALMDEVHVLTVTRTPLTNEKLERRSAPSRFVECDGERSTPWVQSGA